MADITDILQGLTQNVSGLEGLNDALGEFNKQKKEALDAGDGKAYMQLEKLEKITQKYMDTKEKQIEIEEDLRKSKKKGIAVTEKQRASLEKNTKELIRAERNLLAVEKEATRAKMDQIKAAKQYNDELIESYKQNTKLGKTFGILGSGYTKLAGGITAATLAFKAWTRYNEAAAARQDILIQQFRGLGEGAKQTRDGVMGYVDATTNQVDAVAAAAKANMAFSESLQDAKSAAALLGKDVGAMAPLMADFARLTGTKNPKALATLAKSTAVVATSLGITMPEAFDFVKVRMDKFGGTAASAVLALNNIRTESKDVNDMFGRTVVRADDISRSLLEISRSTNVYAIDQRFVSGILRENIAKLQSTGDSYDLAKRKAEAYTKAVTGDAPEWMQILAGQDLAGDLQKSFAKGAETFQAEFGDALDRAAPGLSKKVRGILDDNSLAGYEKMRLLQEITAGSEVGVEAMNKQLLKLADSSQGIVLIAKQFGVSHSEAYGMVKQAQEFEKRQQKIGKLSTANAKTLQKELKITKEQAIALADQSKPMSERKKQIREHLKLQDESAAAEADILRLKEKEAQAEKTEKAIKVIIESKEGDIEAIKTKIAEAEKVIHDAKTNISEATMASDGNAHLAAQEQLKVAEASLKDLKANKKATERYVKGQKTRIEQQKSQASEDQESYNSLEKIATDQLDIFKQMQVGTDRHRDSFLEGLSSIETLLGGIAVVAAAGWAGNKLMGVLSRRWGSKGMKLDDSQVNRIITAFREGGGGGGDGDDRDNRDRKDKKKSKKTKKDSKGKKSKQGESKKTTVRKKSKGRSWGRKRGGGKFSKIMRVAQKGAEFVSNLRDSGSKVASVVEDTVGSSPKGTKTGSKIAPPKTKGILDRVKSAGASIGKMFSGGGMMGKLFEPLSKLAKGLFGTIGLAVTAFMELPEIISNLMAGEWADALAGMIPMATTAIGTVVGGLAGPIGAIVLGGLSGVAGEWAKEAIQNRDRSETKKTADPKKTTPLADKMDKLKKESPETAIKQKRVAETPDPKKTTPLADKMDKLKKVESPETASILAKQKGITMAEAVKTLKPTAPKETPKPTAINITKGLEMANIQTTPTGNDATTEAGAATGKDGLPTAPIPPKSQAQQQPQESQAEGAMGSVNPDGSVLIRVTGLQQAVMGVNQLTRRNTTRQSG